MAGILRIHRGPGAQKEVRVGIPQSFTYQCKSLRASGLSTLASISAHLDGALVGLESGGGR